MKGRKNFLLKKEKIERKKSCMKYFKKMSQEWTCIFGLKKPNCSPQWMRTDLHQSTLLQNFRGLGTKKKRVYKFLEKLEDMK